MTVGLTAGADTKLRLGTAGAAIFCLEAARRVRANCLDAIADGNCVWKELRVVVL